MSLALQQGLAEFNLMRDKAEEGVKGMSGKGPKYFGISTSGDDTKMYFPKKNITELDSHPEMDVAVLVPKDMDTFDLLQPAFGADLNTKEPKTIRAYLRKLLESV